MYKRNICLIILPATLLGLGGKMIFSADSLEKNSQKENEGMSA